MPGSRRKRRRGLARLQGGLLALALAGCGDPAAPGFSDGGCPQLQPDTCPSPAPSYANQVAAIVQARCAVCHNPDGQQPSPVFTDYPSIFASRSAILDQTVACRMPPPGATPLTDDEKRALLGWLVCHAPKN